MKLELKLELKSCKSLIAPPNACHAILFIIVAENQWGLLICKTDEHQIYLLMTCLTAFFWKPRLFMTEYQRNTASFCFYGTIQFLVFTDFDILSYIWYRLGKVVYNVVYNADRIFVRIYKNLIYLQSSNFAAGITKNSFLLMEIL